MTLDMAKSAQEHYDTKQSYSYEKIDIYYSNLILSVLLCY